MPDVGTCLVEVVRHEFGTDYYFHTPLNRAGNDALAQVAVRRLARCRGLAATSLVADLGFAILFAHERYLSADDWRALLDMDEFDEDLAGALGESALLRERFRRVALTGLMLLRNPLGRRPRVGGRDWGERRLFDKVRQADPDFVLLRQAERELRRDLCDAEAARNFVLALPRWAVRCRRLPRVSLVQMAANTAPVADAKQVIAR